MLCVNFCFAQLPDSGTIDTIPGCQAYFSYYQDEINWDASFAGYPYKFEGQSFNSLSEAVSWNWDFGDGATSSEQQPVHYFTHLYDTVEVCLTVVHADGCENTFCDRFVIRDLVPNIECDNGFSIQVLESYPPQYRFVPDKPDSLGFFSWYFGDDTYSYEMTPVHTFEYNGTYNVSMFYTSPDSCTSYAGDTLTAIGSVGACKASWIAYPNFNWDSLDFVPQDITMTSSYFFNDRSRGHITQWKWNFGDGTESTESNTTHEFTEPGIYNVCLEIFTSDGCQSNYCSTIIVDTMIFCDQTGTVRDYTGLDGCGLLIELDNGVVLEPAEVVPNFVLHDGQRVRLGYTELKDRASICMTGLIVRIDCISEISDYGCSADFTYFALPWVSSVPPIYAFELLNANSMIVDEVKWDLGDGTVTNEFTPTHRFPKDGYYTVCLTVNTLTGCRVTNCETAFFEGYDPEPGLCNTYIRLNTDVILNGMNCNGSASATLVDANGNPVSAYGYLWSTGDMGPAIYDLCPNSTYSVIITDSTGCSVSGSFSIGGSVSYPDSLIGYWNYQQDYLDFVFNLPVFKEDIYCEWDFGDGEVAQGSSVSHTYDSVVIYTVTLRVFDDSGNLLYDQQIQVSPGESTAIKQPELKAPRVYPVPATDWLYLTLPDNGSIVSKIEILSSGGQTLMVNAAVNQHDKQIELNVSELPNGFYLGTPTYENGRQQTFRFVK